MKILDCTLRDGGYYTNWDFNEDLVINYCKSMEALPIDYVEVGYRSIPIDGYLGEYFYCPIYVLEKLKVLMPSKKLVIILNEKDIREKHVNNLLEPCKTSISMVRIAVEPKNFDRAIKLAIAIKKIGFEVAFNVMYMSKWTPDDTFLNNLDKIGGVVDYFYMVDSFGGMMPNEVQNITKLVKSKTEIPLGFHGHNNLEMALINTKMALDAGCEIIDATITGMGRGAGNLKTELLLTYLNKHNDIKINYSALSNTVSDFENLNKNYNWGTSLPYMFSGAFSLPQKQVMEWVSMNRYSMESIVNALNNKKENTVDNISLPYFESKKQYKKAFIIGGGISIVNHLEAIKEYIRKNKDIAVVFAGVRYVEILKNLNCEKFIALTGRELSKLPKNEIINYKQVQFVYAPFPRFMGTVIDKTIMPYAKELKNMSFTESLNDSPLAIAIQTGLDLKVKIFQFIGFDGYASYNDSSDKYLLANENQLIFDDLMKLSNIQIEFLNKTSYNITNIKSIYNQI